MLYKLIAADLHKWDGKNESNEQSKRYDAIMDLPLNCQGSRMTGMNSQDLNTMVTVFCPLLMRKQLMMDNASTNAAGQFCSQAKLVLNKLIKYHGAAFTENNYTFCL